MPFLPALSDDRTFFLMAQLLAGLGDDDYEAPEFKPLARRMPLRDPTEQEHRVGAHVDDFALVISAAAGTSHRRRQILQMSVKIGDTPVTVLCDTSVAHGIFRESMAKMLGIKIQLRHGRRSTTAP
jgi:hypothetical protein